jgi:hypothetical protein
MILQESSTDLSFMSSMPNGAHATPVFHEAQATIGKNWYIADTTIIIILMRI